MNIIKAKDVSKKYGGNIALENFSFEISEGEIIALLGPNGAGKTTFVKALLGLVNLDEGEVKLFDAPIGDVDAKKNISYLPEKFNFYSYFTLQDTLNFYAKMYEVSDDTIDDAIANAAKKINIEDLLEKKISDCSKGQLQRLGIACAILGEHKLIILDEPFSGLDPIGMKEVRDICLDLKKMGKTVLINSHILAEMEKVADRVFIINKGKLELSGSISDLAQGEGLEQKFFNIVKGQGSTNA
jgi:ABC-2 type transport system ATP-binding protein